VSVLFVASERPKYAKDGVYLGAHGRLLDTMLRAGGFERADCHVVYADQYRNGMPKDFDAVVLGGALAAKTVLGWNAPPSYYHGSVLPEYARGPTSYDAYRSWLKLPPKYVVTFDIPTLHASWDLHPLATRDWQRAGDVARGAYRQPDPDKWEWVCNEPSRLGELAGSSMLVFDTELSPVWMIGFANDKQVHVCDWNWETGPASRALLTDPRTVKVAHNLQHDLSMCELRFGFRVEPPYFDTYGGSHLLNTALERTLSPGLSSRFTNWPYHKWLSNIDATRYNGLDNIVCYDGAVEIREQLYQRRLVQVSDHDHRLLDALHAMQITGFRVSEAERAVFEEETAVDLDLKEEECRTLARPVIEARLDRFLKPGLFRVQKQCTCCGGGKASCKHCWRCGGLPAKPEKKADYYAGNGMGHEHGKVSVARLREMLPACRSLSRQRQGRHVAIVQPRFGGSSCRRALSRAQNPGAQVQRQRNGSSGTAEAVAGSAPAGALAGRGQRTAGRFENRRAPVAWTGRTLALCV
jgi:hypothetical protein